MHFSFQNLFKQYTMTQAGVERSELAQRKVDEEESQNTNSNTLSHSANFVCSASSSQ